MDTSGSTTDRSPAQQPYDYSTRSGVLPISWRDFHGICKALAVAAAGFRPQIVLAVGRGGFYPGALLAHMLQVEIYPVRVSRRVDDQIVYDSPRWLLQPPALVQGRRVLIVDEISGTGETLAMVRARALEMGAAEARCAVLYAHTWGADIPDYIGLISDALILNPWDREILRDGEFQFHPEYVQALALLGVAAGPELLIAATPFTLARERSSTSSRS